MRKHAESQETPSAENDCSAIAAESRQLLHARRNEPAFDTIRVTRGDITGAGPLHVVHVAVRRIRSRRKCRQDVVHACLLARRSARREMHPAREMRLNATWYRKAWLHQQSGAPSTCVCGAATGAPETCPFCGEARG